MRTKILAEAAIGLAVIFAVPQISPAETTPPAQISPAARENLKQAITHLQKARYHLAMADRTFGGDRADGLEQTQYALEQAFAAARDDAWKAQDKKLWEKQRKEGEEHWKKRSERGEVAKDEAPHFRITSAIEELKAARSYLDRIEGSGYGGHKTKALKFVDEATKALQEGLRKAENKR